MTTTTSSRRAVAGSTPRSGTPGGHDSQRAEAIATPNNCPPAGVNGRRADLVATPEAHPRGGTDSHPADGDPVPIVQAPGGTDSRRANRDATTIVRPPVGDYTRPTIESSAPGATTSGGDDHAGRQSGNDAQMVPAASVHNTRRAAGSAEPMWIPPVGAADPHPAGEVAMPMACSPGGVVNAGRRSQRDAQYPVAASGQPADRHVGADNQQPAAVGDPAAGRLCGIDTQTGSAAGRRARHDTHSTSAAGRDTGPGRAAAIATEPVGISLLDPWLGLAADILDDFERVRIANENRLRQLTRSVEDSDGQTRGFGLDQSHPDVAKLATMVDTLRQLEHQATLNLGRHMRRHPLGPWVKAQKGVGDKQAARLLALIGDPYIRPQIVRADNTVLPEGPRTVSALWAYCGLHVLPAGRGSVDTQSPGAGRDQLPADTQGRSVGGGGGDPDQRARDDQSQSTGVAARRTRGTQANWSTKAKTRAYLVAESCMKQLSPQCRTVLRPRDTQINPDGPALRHRDDCTCSPYRVVYDTRRAHTAATRPDWTDGHAHTDALRVAAKAFLRDLWRAARDHHEAAMS